MALLDDTTPPANTSQPSTSQTGSAPGQPAVNTNSPVQKPQTGTGFTNLNKFIGANQNNQLGTTVQNGVGSAANQVKAGVSNVQNSFINNLNANRLDNDQNKQEVSTVLNNVGNVNDNQIQDFSKFRSGQYTGPTDLGDVSNLQNQAQRTENMVNQGQDALLSRFVGGNQYTAGQKRLDNILLGQTGGDALKNARQQVNGLGQTVTNAQNLAQQQGQNAVDSAKQFGQDVTNQTTSAYGNLNNQLEDRVKSLNDYETQKKGVYDNLVNTLNSGTAQTLTGLADTNGVTTHYQAAYNAIDQALKNNLLNDADAQKLSMLIPAAQYMGVDPETLIRNQLSNNSGANLTRTSLASADERRGIDSLDRLLGNNSEFYSANDLLRDNASNAGQQVDNAKRTYDLSQYQNGGQLAASLGSLNLNAEGANRYLANTASSMAGHDMPYANSQVNQTVNPTVLGIDPTAQLAALSAANKFQGIDPTQAQKYQNTLGATQQLAKYSSDAGGRMGISPDGTNIDLDGPGNDWTKNDRNFDELSRVNQMYGTPFQNSYGVGRGNVQDIGRFDGYLATQNSGPNTNYTGNLGAATAQGNIDQNIINNLPLISNMLRR